MGILVWFYWESCVKTVCRMVHVLCHLSNGRQYGACIGVCHCTGFNLPWVL